MAQRFDPDLLSEDDIFEIDAQAAHLFKHPYLGEDDIYDVGQRSAVLPGEAAGGTG